MSIDREINSRVDAFGSNPQALQKRYSMTKELVDLLALQKIKKDMDSARASVEAQMQTNPATIKQQREQEIFGRTAQDVAQQVGGALQTAQNQKQMAQRRPAPQGLGALMPQQGQRPQQPQRMQAGGIVAFQTGGGVDKQIAELINQGLSDDEIRAEAARLGLLPQAADRIIQQVRLQQKQDMSLQPPQPKTQSIDLASDDPVLATQGTQPQPKPTMKAPTRSSREITAGFEDTQQNLRDIGVKPQTAPAPDPTNTGIRTAAKGFPKVTNEDGTRKSATQLVTEMDPLESPQIDTSQANQAGLAVLKDFGMGPDDLKDPEQYRKDVRDDEADFFRRDEKMKRYEGLLTDQRTLDEAQSDPRALAREQLQAGLIGMAGRGSTAGAGFGAGAMTMDRSQRRDAQARLKRVADMVDNMEKQDFEVAKSASAAGREALTQAAQNRRTALEAMYTMRGQELNTIRKQAEMDYNANKDNIKNLLEATLADSTRDLKLAIEQGSQVEALNKILESLAIRTETAIGDFRDAFVNSNAYTAAFTKAKATNIANQEQVNAQGRAELEALEKQYTVMVQQMITTSGVADLERDIRARLGLPKIDKQVRFTKPDMSMFDTPITDDDFGKMTVSPSSSP